MRYLVPKSFRSFAISFLAVVLIAAPALAGYGKTPRTVSSPPVSPNTSSLFGHDATASLPHRSSSRQNIRARSGHGEFFRTLLARRHATPTPSPTPVPAADPAVTMLARREFVLRQAGQIDGRLLSPQFRANMTQQQVEQASQELGPLGALTGMQYLGPVSDPDLPPRAHAYLYKMICTNGSIYEQIFVDDHGKIAGEQFRDTLATPTP